MAGNIIVTTTVNKVTWDVDKSAYGRAMKQVRSLKKEWEKPSRAMQGKKTNPAATYIKSAQQAKLVSKRLAQTERAEQTKTTNHAIAMAKKRMRAEDNLTKQHAARRAQVVKQMTARNPELAQMRKYYQGLQKGKSGFLGSDWKSPNKPGSYGLGTGGRGSVGGGVVGRGQASNPERLARQNAAMAGQRQPPSVDPKAERARAAARKQREREDRAYDKQLSNKETTINDNAIRLRSRYGNNYAKKLGGKNGGLDGLNNKFLDTAKMRSSSYRAELAAMERQLRATNSAGLSFADGMKTLRRSMIGMTAAYTAFSAASSVLSTGQFFQGMNATMAMVSDDSVEAGQRLEFVQKQAYRLGLNLKYASQGYTQMAIAADGVISKSQNDDLFKGYSEYATALQVDPVKYQRGIIAIQQMLGKGQIAAEELKNQLSEAIPGSMKVFVNAAQKYFKDDKIGIPELLKLMKDGKLLAKDIMPFVGEEFAKAANKGGALEKALKSNRVAMQRMQQTWMNFQNKIFESGFGETMTEVFNGIADLLSDSGPVAEALGQLSAGFITSFMEIFYTVSDVFTAITLLIQDFLKSVGVEMDNMDKAFNWTGRALGALFFFMALSKVFGILSKIVGLGAGLAFLKNIFGGPDGDNEGGDRRRRRGGGGGGKKILAGLGILGVASALDLGFDNTQDPDFYKKVQANNDAPTMWTDLTNWWSNLGKDHEGARLNYLNSQSLMPGGASSALGGAPAPVTVAPLEGEIKLTIDAGELSKMIDAQIDISGMQDINLLTSGLDY